VDIAQLNAELKTTVAKIDQLRKDIDAIVAEIDGEELEGMSSVKFLEKLLDGVAVGMETVGQSACSYQGHSDYRWSDERVTQRWRTTKNFCRRKDCCICRL
jgi:hypothetical protein